MPERSLDHHALEGVLPHRGVNLIADRVVIRDGAVHSDSHTLLPASDPRGRHLLTRAGAGARVWYEPFIGELMALTGVPLLDERLKAAGQVAVFSMISKVVCPDEAPVGQELVGTADITRDRGSFTQFATRATSSGRTVLEAEVMSGCASFADITGRPVRPFAGGTPGTSVDAALFAWKDASQRYIHTIVEEDRAAGSIVCAYAYPHDHPFVPGHFPGAPLMMGVTQWAAVADAAFLAGTRFGLGARVVANGTIVRPDGGEVLDVRELVLEIRNGIPRIAATKRIAFREPVRPGDGLLVRVTVTAG